MAQREAQLERRIWQLLTRDFYWTIPTEFPVQVYDRTGGEVRSARLQVFEIAITTVLARLRPEFSWCVTQNRPDEGLDFIGEQRLLDDRDLGIEAAITIGGQCKKRTTVSTVENEIAGSLITMMDTHDPTLFVFALSARVAHSRVEKARRRVERATNRHCHILDRAQIEGLFASNIDIVTPILAQGLTASERDDVISYLRDHASPTRPPEVSVSAPNRVLAGRPFRIQIDIRWPSVSDPIARLWWRAGGDSTKSGELTLLGPLGADGLRGVGFVQGDDPMRTSCSIELSTYAAGTTSLGELHLGTETRGIDNAFNFDMGVVEVVETVRPRFFERPHRPALNRLDAAFQRANTGTVEVLGIVGSGGSGKTRMCEEFALDRRRRGYDVVSARQAKTHEAPHRILAELLANLAGVSVTDSTVEEVITLIAGYDRDLALRCDSALRAVFGVNADRQPVGGDSDLLSAVLVLIAARCRRTTVVLHLQEMHWCGADTLLLLERLLWRIGAAGLFSQSPLEGSHGHGVLILLEGRIRESGDSGGQPWSSAPFESFLERNEVPQVLCEAFSNDDSLEFVRLLFEGVHNVDRLVPDELLPLQRDLIEQIDESAGGNPFHTLEHIGILRDRRILGRNRKTGLLYLIRPEPSGSFLPDSVFAAIELRWRYLRERSPEMALLLWACALVGDQLPMPLFEQLWQALAPKLSLRAVDATDILWTGDGSTHEVVFRHEHYFESLRRFTVGDEDREQVISAYRQWYERQRRLSAAERFRWAQVSLKSSTPDFARSRALLANALARARRQADDRLARRILAFALDLTWTSDERERVPVPIFNRSCDQEVTLCRELLNVDRDQAAMRIKRLRQRLESRLMARSNLASGQEALEYRSLLADAVYAQLLFNDRRSTESAERSAVIIDRIREYPSEVRQGPAWEALEMEALYTLSCAQALSGNFGLAVQSSAAASAIAETSESLMARKIVSTYGTMLLSEDPRAGEQLLRGCLARWLDEDTSDSFLVHVHLAMALVLQAYDAPPSVHRSNLLLEAAERSALVHHRAQRLGFHPDAGASALVRGVVGMVQGDGEGATWFAHGVAAAARGRQMEVLWRSHINLATALHAKYKAVTPSVHDHAAAALDILEDTLAPYSDPDLSPRFQLIRIGMANAVAFQCAAGDPAGVRILERFPRLRSHFSDPSVGRLAEEVPLPRHYQWLRVEGADYILY